MEETLIEIVWPQELPEDIKVYVENGHYWIDFASPILYTRQNFYGDIFDLQQENAKLRHEISELRKD